MDQELLPLLFSFKGRIPRSTWWAFLVASLVVAILVVVVALPAIRGIGLVGILLVFSVFWAALLWVSFAVGAKRLHDRDRTGWWQAVPILIGTLASVLAFEAVFPALIGASFEELGTFKELDAVKELGSVKKLGTAVQLLDLVSFASASGCSWRWASCAGREDRTASALIRSALRRPTPSSEALAALDTGR